MLVATTVSAVEEETPRESEIELTAAQSRVVRHREGPMLVSGPAGSGRSEALLRRLESLTQAGVPPQQVLVLVRSRAVAARLRARANALVSPPYEELWIGTYEAVAERLLSEYALQAGLDPFFATVRLADRLALLLDHLDDLSLRRHEIRGNAAGLLARLLRRIDALKAEGISPGRLRSWAEERERDAAAADERERARREREFAELYASHDRIVREGGSLDSGDVIIELERLLRERPDVRSEMAERFRFVMVDELEDAGAAHRALIAAIAEHENVVCACDVAQSVRRPPIAAVDPGPSFMERYPVAEHVTLDRPLRFGAAVALAATAVIELAGESARRRAESDDDGGSRVRFWRCATERAEAQAAAREIEHLLAAGEVRPEAVCVVVGSGWREARLVAAALEERAVPFRFAGDAALFQRPEVRDVLAWLRMLADPTDSAAVVRALTRPPVELRSIDLARCTAIARRRKLDMISALDAALESPQLPPEARDRIKAFLKLQRSASAAMEEMRADVFVRRLIERIGLRRHRLFVATPEAAERLQSLSRLSELAAAWTRREPRGSVRDFVRHLSAVADAGELDPDDAATVSGGSVVLAEPEQVKGLEFEHVYLLGLHRAAIAARDSAAGWLPRSLLPGDAVAAGADDPAHAARARLAYLAMTRPRRGLVLSWPAQSAEGQVSPSPFYEAARDALGADEEIHEEELFGPAEGLHSTYRMLRDEVLEASWRAGSALSEMRLDTAEDVTEAVARYLELIKLAALVQRPGTESASEAISALNELLGRAASPEQRAALESSTLDEYVVSEERDVAARRELVAARREPSLEQFIPRRGDGLALSASDIDLYRTCPLKYKFARVFAIPREPTINQRFGILIHQVLERFHTEVMRAEASRAPAFSPTASGPPGTLDRLLFLFEAGWRRAGFGASDDELQYRDRAVAALARYHERQRGAESRPVWLERGFSFTVGDHQLRGRVDRVDQRADGRYELIDYKTGEAGSRHDDGVQLALYRVAARSAWQIDADSGSYWYVLDDERVEVPSAPDDAERVERTVLEVGAGIQSQDFEPRPSYEICSWCDYRLICPASEA
jgi:DNA helicase II / ATP-dependent DNA helicase PcrA